MCNISTLCLTEEFDINTRELHELFVLWNVQNGGIYVDFHDGSGDDSVYEDVYHGFDASGGQSCNIMSP